MDKFIIHEDVWISFTETNITGCGTGYWCTEVMPCSECPDCDEYDEYDDWDCESGEDTEMQNTIEHYRLSEGQDFLSSIMDDKRQELREKFHMDAQNKGPKTFGEILDAIKDGKVTFKEITPTQREFTAIDSWGNSYDYSWLKFIDFVDPAAPKADTEGYEAAVEKLSKAREDTSMKLTFTTDPAAQLKLLQDFQSSTIN